MADQLLKRLKAIRTGHGPSQLVVAACMGIHPDSLRHIESGLRPIPDFLHGRIAWIRSFLKCVEATPEEEREALELAARSVVEQFDEWLRDLNRHVP